jgi:hypothetical protein
VGVLLVAVGAAFAGVPVVHDGDGGAAVSQVAQRTGLPPDQLEAVPLSQLLEAPTSVLGAAAMRHCSGAATRVGDVKAELVRAEAALREGEDRSAMDHLDLAVAAMGCLSELVEPGVGARVFLLRGALMGDRDEEAALGELRSALGFDPALSWEPGFPEAGEALLEAARGAGTPSVLAVSPAGTSAGPWIDGRTLSGSGAAREVAPGLHLAQSPGIGGIQSAWLVIEGDAHLVLPGSFRSTALAQLSEDSKRPEVEALIAAALDQTPAAYAASGGGLWLVTVTDGAPATEQLVAPAEAEEEGKKRRRGRR